jgi:membrane protease YdiL (CAAX protease family)
VSALLQRVRSIVAALLPVPFTLVAWQLASVLLMHTAPVLATSTVLRAVTHCIAALIAYLLVEVVVLGHSYEAIGLGRRSAVRHLTAGIGVGIGLVAIVVAILALSGSYSVVSTSTPSLSSLADVTIMWAAVGVWEEVIFRGVVARRAGLAFGAVGLVVASVVVFAVAHASVAHGDIAGLAMLGVAGGVLFAAAWLAAGNLWLPIGLHMGWNFAEGTIFGLAVSSNRIEGTLIQSRVRGSHWLTGGALGPEGGVAVLATCVCAAVVMFRIYRRQTPAPADALPSER